MKVWDFGRYFGGQSETSTRGQIWISGPGNIIFVTPAKIGRLTLVPLNLVTRVLVGDTQIHMQTI